MSSPVDVALPWRPSPLALGLATCAATALVAALLSGQWPLVVFAAPLLGALGARRWLPTAPESVRVHAVLATPQCFEGEEVDVSVSTRASGGQASLAIRPVETPGLQLVDDAARCAGQEHYRVRAAHWGSYPLHVQVTASAAGGLLTAVATAEGAQLRVYPMAPPEPIAWTFPQLANRLGTHRSHRHGPGVEYADIRTYVPGDQLRSVNWPVSARRNQLHVTERFTDRAADVVAVIDAYPQQEGPATAALDLAVLGATQVVQSALRAGDRAGVVALGERVRWLGPDAGRRQFYRVLDTVLDFGNAPALGTGTLVPRHALPPGSVVVAFSSLLRTDFTFAMIDLRKRGHTVLVVDVLQEAPFDRALDPIAARWWRLERRGVHRNLGLSGIDMLNWPADTPLAATIRAHSRPPVRR